MIGREEAESILNEVVEGVSKWRSLALSLGISRREIDLFEQVYTNKNNEL